MEIKEKYRELICRVRDRKPLIHHITNYVTVNDCANIVLALGGSPVMADASEEVEDMVSIAAALVINIGTLNSTKVEAMIKAGKKANELGVPVILDPVGVGATPYRKETALKLLKEVKFSVIRGNLAEIKTLCGMNALSKGVDSEEAISEDAKIIAKDLAAKLNSVIVISGAVDYISDGIKIISVRNGHRMLTDVTGTGCMSTSLIGTYCGVTKDYFAAASAGIITMGIAGEMAFERLSDIQGSGSFKVNIIDAIYKISYSDLNERGNYAEEC
ncbi:hydroxyethylthiazole kinase [Clostridium sp. SYSU_GA19001]|uniref:hydroxyethylthiazole kinase n=1 Tax=Clostridium caldaquaticum TaxID=2940653 RepID=UPI0020776908|nr:hydroxyethylthiazole kinase [Clostridium caldaquaticum]MCM8710276.1 hydroxyethylthiazole kinase [Clostridium caldaquaticum]